MIIIPIKEKESVERALKRFKRKFERTGVIKELRERQAYKKPSVKKREALINAVYKQKLRQQEENE
jgi:small subunit ribosomal protein S21